MDLRLSMVTMLSIVNGRYEDVCVIEIYQRFGKTLCLHCQGRR